VRKGILRTVGELLRAEEMARRSFDDNKVPAFDFLEWRVVLARGLEVVVEGRRVCYDS